MLPNTATGGQGGISPGLAPGKSRKVEWDWRCAQPARQVAEMSQRGQIGIAVKEANMSKGLR